MAKENEKQNVNSDESGVKNIANAESAPNGAGIVVNNTVPSDVSAASESSSNAGSASNDGSGRSFVSGNRPTYRRSYGNFGYSDRRNNIGRFYNNNNSNNGNYRERKDNSAEDGNGGFKYNRFRRRRKICEFCAENLGVIDYKDVSRLSKFLTERGKIVTRRSAGTCTKHQRELTKALKRARKMVLLPYCRR